MQELGHGEWLAPIRKTVASTGEGVAELAVAIDEHRAWLGQSGQLDSHRLARARLQLREIALVEVRARFAALDEGELVEKLAGEIARRETDPYSAADRLLASLEG
jgi:LAO/AO transport system kinase